jgi:hypothetical protein
MHPHANVLNDDPALHTPDVLLILLALKEKTPQDGFTPFNAAHEHAVGQSTAVAIPVRNNP